MRKPGPSAQVSTPEFFEALKARNREWQSENIVIALRSTLFRAFSAKELQRVPPGPMAQAFTFRAFGAETRLLDLVSRDLPRGPGRAAVHFIVGGR